MAVNWQQYVDYLVARGNIDDCLFMDSSDGYTWASTNSFDLREYRGNIIKEDGTEEEQTINEAVNLTKLMEGVTPSQGLRMNNGKKHQILRNFIDEETKGRMIYSKTSKAGACIAVAGPVTIVGTFDENKGHTSAGCNEVVTLMARHLVKAPWPSSTSSSGISGGDSSNSNWQQFVDLLLIGKGNVSDALICSAESGDTWASTKDFGLKKYSAPIMDEGGNEHDESVDEAKNLVSFMSGSSPHQGLRLNESRKYQIVKAGHDDDMGSYVINGKKIKGGCWIGRAKSAIIVAVYDETKEHTASGCSIVIANLIKHLNSVDF